MTKANHNLSEALNNCQTTVEACVIVGGSLLWKNQSQLESCTRNGIAIKLLFPNPATDWLEIMVSAAGMSIEDYAPRILRSATLAQQMGLDIRWYTTAVTNWFVLVDRKMVWQKRFSLTQQTIPKYETLKHTVDYYSKIFDSMWRASSKEPDSGQRNAGVTQVQIPDKLSRDRLPELLELLVNRFSEDELRTLCFYLNIDFEILPAGGKVGKVRELINYLNRRERVFELVIIGNQLRPDIDWNIFKA